jgi:hypothetical protein
MPNNVVGLLTNTNALITFILSEQIASAVRFFIDFVSFY